MKRMAQVKVCIPLHFFPVEKIGTETEQRFKRSILERLHLDSWALSESLEPDDIQIVAMEATRL